MQSLDEIARVYIHSKLIHDTGRIFLDIENYEKQGLITRQEYPTPFRSSRRMQTIPLAISAPLLIVMLGILEMQYFSKNHDSEKLDNTISTQVQTNDRLEDKIQVFFPDHIPLIESSTKLETEPAPSHQNYYKDTPSPEEIAYVGAFKSFLEAHLRSKGFIFPKPEDMNRTCQLPHAYYADFIIDEKGNVQLKSGSISSVPPCFPDDNLGHRRDDYWTEVVKWDNSVDKYYSQLFSDMPKFIPPSDHNLATPYIIDLIGIFNALTRDGNRVYWFLYEYEELYRDFNLGKLKVISPKPIHKD